MTGLRFRETMTGRVALRSVDPVSGYRSAEAVATSMRAEIDIPDVAAFIDGDRHQARLRAEVIIPVFGGRFVSENGTFVCFERGIGSDGLPVRQMIYTATFVNDDRVFEMSARKILQPGFRLWSDTTTLHVALVDESLDPDAERPRRVAGLIRITLPGFIRQVLTMQPYGSDSRWQRCRAFLAYGWFFVGGLVKTYLLRARW